MQADPDGASCLNLVRPLTGKNRVLATTGPVAFTVALKELTEKITKVNPNLDGTVVYDGATKSHGKLDSKHYTRQKGPLILQNSPKITLADLEKLDSELREK